MQRYEKFLEYASKYAINTYLSVSYFPPGKERLSFIETPPFLRAE